MLRFGISAVLASAFLMSAVPSEASIKVQISRPNFNAGGSSTVYDLTSTWGGGGGGGEFKVDVLESTEPVVTAFKTFCLEISEHISIGGVYYASLDSSAVGGGGGATGSPPSDPLSNATKWLYFWYVDSALQGVQGFSYNSTSSANSLQQAFWYLEDEVTWGSLSTMAKNLVNYANSYAGSNAWDADNGDVLVLNLWGNEAKTQPKQSQLYFQPPPVHEDEEVPEPMSVAVWTVLAAIGGVVYRRRTAVA